MFSGRMQDSDVDYLESPFNRVSVSVRFHQLQVPRHTLHQLADDAMKESTTSINSCGAPLSLTPHTPGGDSTGELLHCAVQWHQVLLAMRHRRGRCVLSIVCIAAVSTERLLHVIFRPAVHGPHVFWSAAHFVKTNGKKLGRGVQLNLDA